MDDSVMMALRKASEIRRLYKINAYHPLNIYDLCSQMGITVRFVEINMEGMYFIQNDGSSPQILISNQRPFPRRAYTCAHELGHHLFKHGSKVDHMTEESSKGYDGDEFIVDAFAGALLMPVAAVLAAFAKRDWNINSASQLQFYIIASTFGIGYRTLITHCQKNNILNPWAAKTLMKYTPAKILEIIIGTDHANSHFKILDELNSARVVDLEVNNFIILPETATWEGNHLTKVKSTPSGAVYLAEKPGITRIVGSAASESYFVRVQNAAYIGLAEFRHLENPTD